MLLSSVRSSRDRKRSRYTQHTTDPLQKKASHLYPFSINHTPKKQKQSDAASQKALQTTITTVAHKMQRRTTDFTKPHSTSTSSFSHSARSLTYSSCPTLLYLPLPLSPLPFLTKLLIQPPTPSSRSESLLRIGLPSWTSTAGGSMSRSGTLGSMLEPSTPSSPRRNEGTGERASPKSDSASASVSGVGAIVVASPKREFMSSRRTLAVSG